MCRHHQLLSAAEPATTRTSSFPPAGMMLKQCAAPPVEKLRRAVARLRTLQEDWRGFANPALVPSALVGGEATARGLYHG